MAAAAIWKITKIAISPQRFDQSLRNLLCWCKMGLLTAPTVKKFEFHKSKMADGRHFKNCYIILSQQPFDWYTQHHVDIQAMWWWVISPFNDLCGFWSVAVNTMDKLQFLVLITTSSKNKDYSCSLVSYYNSLLVLLCDPFSCWLVVSVGM